ncbi:MAG: phosphoadenylyl-sulfate reductase [Lysobacterales bacterium]
MSAVALCENQSRSAAASCANASLSKLTAQQRVRWSLENLPGEFMLSSSFGIQSALMLHLVTQEWPDIPVVLIDTGYLFPETYQFVDQLNDRLKLNLKVYQPRMSPAWQEAMYGKRWEQGRDGMDAYNEQAKVVPMRRALDELNVSTWFAGLRRAQSDTRTQREVVELSGERWKVHPIVDWNDRQVHEYLQTHDLPYHPLREKGYVSIGDWHSTQSLLDVEDETETRFMGLGRECGLHTLV